MNKLITQEIEIPEGVDVEIHKGMVNIKGPEGHNKRDFNITKLTLEKKDNKIMIYDKNASKNEKKRINTIAAHIENMLRGVSKKFEYKLKVCFSHFPMTVSVEGNEAIIKNFLGEKVPRKTSLPEGIEVKINKENITITSTDKELAGQAAANFENATIIKKRDRRRFQDGIFITSKDGEEI